MFHSGRGNGASWNLSTLSGSLINQFHCKHPKESIWQISGASLVQETFINNACAEQEQVDLHVPRFGDKLSFHSKIILLGLVVSVNHGAVVRLDHCSVILLNESGENEDYRHAACYLIPKIDESIFSCG